MLNTERLVKSIMTSDLRVETAGHIELKLLAWYSAPNQHSEFKKPMWNLESQEDYCEG